MRILILNDGFRGVAERTRMDLLLQLQNFHSVNVYGPEENKRSGSETAPLVYNASITTKDLINKFNPDIFLLVLSLHRSKNWISREGLSDLNKSNIPLIVLEEDHFTATGNKEISSGNDMEVLNWYKNFNVDLVLRRHSYEEDAPVPSVWFPFSANTKEFFSNNSIKRINLIGFAGDGYQEESKVPIFYRTRSRAIAKLKEVSLLAENVGKIGKEKYPEYIRNHVGCLACSGSKMHTALAKHFEIMLSGTALLTNKVNFYKELFGNKQVYFEYDDECRTVVDIAKIILNDTDKVQEITKNAYDICLERHTDNKRIIELNNILEALVNGKEVPRIWGQ